MLDTGIAYRNAGQRASAAAPTSPPAQFVKGYDFVDDDRLPLDENGHGTHVAGTIAEKTDNGIGLTGLAYRAKLMPVRVLDSHGRGRGRRHRQGHPLRDRPRRRRDQHELQLRLRQEGAEVDEALRDAYARGVVTVASVGNLGSETCVSEPATGPRVIGVGGTTEGGCLGDYSLAGKGVDLVAPGGGDAGRRLPLGLGAADLPGHPGKTAATDRFASPGDYVGTSMAAAHVSGVAAMVLAADASPATAFPNGARRQRG